MMNIIWDIPMPVDLDLQPFVGMGVGAAYTETGAAGSGNVYLRDERWDPAYSFIADARDATGRRLAPNRNVSLDTGPRCGPQMRRAGRHAGPLPEQQRQQFRRGPGLRNGPVSFAAIR